VTYKAGWSVTLDTD